MSDKNNLSRRVAGGAAWMLLLRLSLRAIGLVNTMILARLLTPSDFGLVAIAMSVFAFLALIKDFGFDTVIIQMQNPEKKHYDTAWTFNLIFGLGLALILTSSSGIIADFYDAPELQPLIWAISGLFIIGGVSNVGTLDFRKNLTFEKEFKLRIIPKLIGVPFTILIAYWTRSYWALTIGTIVTSCSGLFMGYFMHTYRPRISLAAAKELFSFSKWLMINNLIYFANVRSPELLIGKLLNPQAAGLFTVSNEIGMMVTTEVSASVSRAAYPGYAKIADKQSELKKLYINVISSSAVILCPIAFGFYSVTDLIVPIFLGDQWLSTIPIIKLVAIAGLLMALNSNSGYVFMAIGNPRLTTIIAAIRVSLFLPLLVFLINSSGLLGAAWAVLITTIIMFFITNYMVIRYLPVTIVDLLLAVYRPLFAAFLMATIILSINLEHYFSFNNLLFYLFLKVFLGVGIYIGSIYFIWWITGKKDGPEIKALLAIKHKLFKNKNGTLD